MRSPPAPNTITVPLTADAWSSVNGKVGNADPETKFAFDKALLNVSRFGVTFGGGCSFGHGVNVRGGTATLYRDRIRDPVGPSRISSHREYFQRRPGI